MKIDNSLKFILSIFLSWRVLLLVSIYFAIHYLPLQENFLGGGMQTYLANPYFWSWLNFDGEHYLEIVRQGYQPLTYFFFPLYPVIVKLISILIGLKSTLSLAIVGLVVANISFLIGLLGLYKLTRLDYTKKQAKLTIFLLLLFPTSFFFGSLYTESLFLALVVWAFYFARKKNFILSSLLTGFATATRVIGIAIIPALFFEFYQAQKKDKRLLKDIWALFLMPMGLLIYMYYLKVTTGDPLEFFNTISIFGPQRESGLVLLPQVFYRYIFKILPNLNYSTILGFYTPLLEFVIAGTFLVASIFSFYKLRLSYAIYLAFAYIIPTFSGSFSSMPRYVTVLFPAFLLFSTGISKLSKKIRLIIYLLLFVSLFFSTILFSRGYWVS